MKRLKEASGNSLLCILFYGNIDLSVIDFCTRNKYVPDQIKMGNEAVERMGEYTYLGIVINENLKGSVNNIKFIRNVDKVSISFVF